MLKDLKKLNKKIVKKMSENDEDPGFNGIRIYREDWRELSALIGTLIKVRGVKCVMADAVQFVVKEWRKRKLEDKIVNTGSFLKVKGEKTDDQDP